MVNWQKGDVVPSKAVNNVFTTGGFDNIDHNPSSTTAKSLLHWTCISIHQHFSLDTQGVEDGVEILNQTEMGKTYVRFLPVCYTNIELDVALPKDGVQHILDRRTTCLPYPSARFLEKIPKEGYSWLEKVSSSLTKQKREVNECISWAAYYASKTEPSSAPPA